MFPIHKYFIDKQQTLFIVLFSERFNETIFDSLPTYLLNICEVCGSSQCPYCSIYNAAIKSPISFVLILTSALAVIFRHYRITNDINWIPPWNIWPAY